MTEPRLDPKGSTSRILPAAPKTINLFLKTVRGLFHEEVAKGHINRNPLSHVRNMPLEKKKPEYYPKEELERFFAVEMHAAYRRAFYGLLLTGMRFGEVANLRFEDVDMSARVLHRQSYEGFQTKTHSSERTIPMSRDLFALLDEILSDPLSEKYVFASPLGHQLRERSLLQVCKRIGKSAELRCRMFLHKFRHTFATHLVQAGVPLAHIKALLGHHSISMTEIYGHSSADHLHTEVRNLDGLIPEKKGQLG